METLRTRCPSCQKLYSVDPQLIKSSEPEFECVQCHERFFLKLPAAEAPTVAKPAKKAKPTPKSRPAWLHRPSWTTALFALMVLAGVVMAITGFTLDYAHNLIGVGVSLVLTTIGARFYIEYLV